MTRLLTLTQACAQLGDKITPAMLRAQAVRGTLDIVRIGRRDFVTADALEAMVSACLVARPRHVSISTQRAVSGSSETERRSSALASLNQTLMEQKRRLRNTSEPNTNRRADPIR